MMRGIVAHMLMASDRPMKEALAAFEEARAKMSSEINPLTRSRSSLIVAHICRVDAT
jgi:hypothetical protein